MKIYFLILIFSSSALAMQQPGEQQLLKQLIDATREGNLQLVTTLVNSHPYLQKSIKDYYSIATNTISNFPVQHPDRTSAYMKIGRFLVGKGAHVHPEALKKLVEYEKNQATEAKNKPAALIPVSKPAAAQPKAPVVTTQPKLAVPTPVAKPVAVSQPKPSPASAATAPTDFNALSDLLRLPIQNEAAIKDYLQTHSLNNLTVQQKSDLLTLAINIAQSLYLTSADQLKSTLSSISLLLQKGIEPTATHKDRLAQVRKGRLSPRTDLFPTKLVKAIRDGKDLAEIKRLVEQENENVDQAGTDNTFPLQAATQRGSKEIAQYLMDKGAQVNSDWPGYQRQDLSKLLGRPL